MSTRSAPILRLPIATLLGASGGAAATRAELGADFSGLPDYARLDSTVVQCGNALLLVFNESPSN